MADELRYTVGMTRDKNDLKTTPMPTTTFTRDASDAVAMGELSVGTSEEAIPMGDVTTPGVAVFYNLDDTNYVDVRKATGGSVITRIQAGECSLVHMDPGDTAPYIIANTAACLVWYAITQAA